MSFVRNNTKEWCNNVVAAVIMYKRRRIVQQLLIVLYYLISIVTSLSTVSPQQQKTLQQLKPIQRIAIIGCGISGLSVAHALTNNVKYNNNNNIKPKIVDMYDSRTYLDTTAGAGIQLNGGLYTLGLINPTIQQYVYNTGLQQTHVQSRCKSWNTNNNNKLYDTLLQIDLKQTIQKQNGKTTEVLLQKNDNNNDTKLLWISIMRGALQKILYDTLPNNNNNVQFGKKLQSLIKDNDNDNTIYCQFTDGTKSGPYDLIIGCEGINSITKQYVNNERKIFNTKDNYNSNNNYNNKNAALYSGIRIRYAVQDGDSNKNDIAKTKTATLTQYFADGAYALTGIYGNGYKQPYTKCAYIIYLDDNYFGPFPKKKNNNNNNNNNNRNNDNDDENVDWTQDKRENGVHARQIMLQQLDTCNIPDNDDLRPIIENDKTRFFDLGVYYHNPFNKWYNNNIVLCGDSAHALPPFLGQGSNQAIQDAYCLVEKIYEYNKQFINNNENNIDEYRIIQEYLNEYEKIRWPATFNIFWKSAFLGYLETGGFDGFYSKFRDLFFKTMGIIGVAKKVLLDAATPKIK